MQHLLPRSILCGAIFFAVLSAAAVAQDKERDPEDYRRFFKKPETVMEYWVALQFELDVGREDLAARHLRGLLFKKPTEAELLAIIDKDGTIPILKLRNIRTWSRDKKEQAQALKDVEELIKLATDAQKKRLGDPVRIRNLIALLKATAEERAYAYRELYKSGALALPTMIDSLLKAKDPEERHALLQGLERMGASSTAPLVAALDCDDAQTKVDVLEILRKRHVRYSAQIIPFLWYLSASRTQPPAVREKAAEVLSEFLNVPVTRLTPAKAALTRLAERYYEHQITFGDPAAVTIWRWDGKGVTPGWPGAPTVTASQAEEYYGLRFARHALNLDPAYRPAQVVMLSTAIDKAVDRGGMAAPLSKSAPLVAELLAKSSPDLVIEVLDRAIKEKRTGVVLAAVRSLGDRQEVRAKRPNSRGEPPLVRALYYQDPRVQLAAVESLLRIPGEPAPRTSARIVEILARVLTPLVAMKPGAKVLVAVGDEGWRFQVRQAVLDAGGEPILVGTGREALQKLRAKGEIEIVLMESSLPMPGLANLLAQMRTDVDVGRIPIVLAAVPETRVSHDAAARYRVLQKRLDLLNEQTIRYRNELRRIADAEAAERKEVALTSAALLRSDRIEAANRVAKKYDDRRKLLAREDLSGAKMVKEMEPLADEMARLTKIYELESRVRENSLARFTNRYANIQVVHSSQLTDAKTLETRLVKDVREAGAALTAAEQNEAAERSIRLLASLAQGQRAGFDVRPATATILDALRAGRLSPEGQVAAVAVSSRLPGPRTQRVLATVILDGARPAAVRTAATAALVEHIQRFSIQLIPAEFEPLRTLRTQPGLDPKLKENLDVLMGSLRPGDRVTGAQLREYKPAPAAIIPPPK